MITHLIATGCVLLAYAAISMVSAPMLVSGRRWTSRFPRGAIVLWIGALGSGAFAMIASLTCAIWAASALGGRPRQALNISTLLTDLGITLASWALTAVVGALIAAAIYQASSSYVTRRALYRSVSESVVRGSRGEAPVRFFESDEARAFSVPGRRPMIMVSARLRDELTELQLSAVIEHERGHLLQRHDRLVQVANVQHRCAPGLPCASSLERSIHVLVELAADDHAVRRCGSALVVDALRRLGAATGDPSLTMRAQRIQNRVPALVAA